MRRRAQAGISAHLSPDTAALARGMVLGEDGDIADATRDDFRRSGLAHLLAASGQNVALLCALVLPLLMLAGAPQRIRVAVLLPLVGIYVALAGSGASITRAGIMAAAGLVAIAAGRRSSAFYALLLAAAITLAVNPRSTADPAWQLSFAAVAGMLALGPALARPLSRLPRLVAEAIGATVAATIATSPLLAHQFGTVSIAALPANVIAFPAVAPIMWIGMAEAAVEQFAGLGFPFSTAAHALEMVAAPVSSLALRWVAGVATRFADPAWAQSEASLSWPGVAAAYALVAAAALVAARTSIGFPGELVDRLRAISPSSRRAFAAPIIAVAIGAAAHAATPPAPPKELTVDFIDVGQGDATLIRDPTGAAVLFDGGVPEARVDRTLKRLGVRKLSVVVATHQSRDHHAGLLQVVKRFPIGLFLDGRYGVRDASFDQLEREVDRRRIARRPAHAGETLNVGQMRIRVIWPPPRSPDQRPPANPNERATVAIVSAGDFDLFLSADAESEVLLPLDLPRVDAMKVPHHGSADPGLPQLLDRLRPRVAAIETGRGNPYGHPTPATLDALRARVPRVYRSDRDGTTELTVTGDRIAIRTHR
jgi:competence protein ComEC